MISILNLKAPFPWVLSGKFVIAHATLQLCPCHSLTPRRCPLFFSLPNVGKSSLTNLLAGDNHAEAANYPFCTIDPNVVQCIVPDKKFEYLVSVFK